MGSALRYSHRAHRASRSVHSLLDSDRTYGDRGPPPIPTPAPLPPARPVLSVCMDGPPADASCTQSRVKSTSCSRRRLEPRVSLRWLPTSRSRRMRYTSAGGVHTVQTTCFLSIVGLPKRVLRNGCLALPSSPPPAKRLPGIARSATTGCLSPTKVHSRHLLNLVDPRKSFSSRRLPDSLLSWGVRGARRPNDALGGTHSRRCRACLASEIGQSQFRIGRDGAILVGQRNTELGHDRLANNPLPHGNDRAPRRLHPFIPVDHHLGERLHTLGQQRQRLFGRSGNHPRSRVGSAAAHRRTRAALARGERERRMQGGRQPRPPDGRGDAEGGDAAPNVRDQRAADEGDKRVDRESTAGGVPSAGAADGATALWPSAPVRVMRMLRKVASPVKRAVEGHRKGGRVQVAQRAEERHVDARERRRPQQHQRGGGGSLVIPNVVSAIRVCVAAALLPVTAALLHLLRPAAVVVTVAAPALAALFVAVAVVPCVAVAVTVAAPALAALFVAVTVVPFVAVAVVVVPFVAAAVARVLPLLFRRVPPPRDQALVQRHKLGFGHPQGDGGEEVRRGHLGRHHVCRQRGRRGRPVAVPDCGGASRRRRHRRGRRRRRRRHRGLCPRVESGERERHRRHTHHPGVTAAGSAHGNRRSRRCERQPARPHRPAPARRRAERGHERLRRQRVGHVDERISGGGGAARGTHSRVGLRNGRTGESHHHIGGHKRSELDHHPAHHRCPRRSHRQRRVDRRDAPHRRIRGGSDERHRRAAEHVDRRHEAEQRRRDRGGSVRVSGGPRVVDAGGWHRSRERQQRVGCGERAAGVVPADRAEEHVERRHRLVAEVCEATSAAVTAREVAMRLGAVRRSVGRARVVDGNHPILVVLGSAVVGSPGGRLRHFRHRRRRVEVRQPVERGPNVHHHTRHGRQERARKAAAHRPVAIPPLPPPPERRRVTSRALSASSAWPPTPAAVATAAADGTPLRAAMARPRHRPRAAARSPAGRRATSVPTADSAAPPPAEPPAAERRRASRRASTAAALAAASGSHATAPPSPVETTGAASPLSTPVCGIGAVTARARPPHVDERSDKRVGCHMHRRERHGRRIVRLGEERGEAPHGRRRRDGGGEEVTRLGRAVTAVCLRRQHRRRRSRNRPRHRPRVDRRDAVGADAAAAEVSDRPHRRRAVQYGRPQVAPRCRPVNGRHQGAHNPAHRRRRRVQARADCLRGGEDSGERRAPRGRRRHRRGGADGGEGRLGGEGARGRVADEEMEARAAHRVGNVGVSVDAQRGGGSRGFGLGAGPLGASAAAAVVHGLVAFLLIIVVLLLIVVVLLLIVVVLLLIVVVLLLIVVVLLLIVVVFLLIVVVLLMVPCVAATAALAAIVDVAIVSVCLLLVGRKEGERHLDVTLPRRLDRGSVPMPGRVIARRPDGFPPRQPPRNRARRQLHSQGAGRGWHARRGARARRRQHVVEGVGERAAADRVEHGAREEGEGGERSGRRGRLVVTAAAAAVGAATPIGAAGGGAVGTRALAGAPVRGAPHPVAARLGRRRCRRQQRAEEADHLGRPRDAAHRLDGDRDTPLGRGGRQPRQQRPPPATRGRQAARRKHRGRRRHGRLPPARCQARHGRRGRGRGGHRRGGGRRPRARVGRRPGGERACRRRRGRGRHRRRVTRQRRPRIGTPAAAAAAAAAAVARPPARRVGVEHRGGSGHARVVHRRPRKHRPQAGGGAPRDSDGRRVGGRVSGAGRRAAGGGGKRGGDGAAQMDGRQCGSAGGLGRLSPTAGGGKRCQRHQRRPPRAVHGQPHAPGGERRRNGRRGTPVARVAGACRDNRRHDKRFTGGRVGIRRGGGQRPHHCRGGGQVKGHAAAVAAAVAAADTAAAAAATTTAATTACRGGADRRPRQVAHHPRYREPAGGSDKADDRNRRCDRRGGQAPTPPHEPPRGRRDRDQRSVGQLPGDSRKGQRRRRRRRRRRRVRRRARRRLRHWRRQRAAGSSRFAARHRPSAAAAVDARPDSSSPVAVDDATPAASASTSAAHGGTPSSAATVARSNCCHAAASVATATPPSPPASRSPLAAGAMRVSTPTNRSAAAGSRAASRHAAPTAAASNNGQSLTSSSTWRPTAATSSEPPPDAPSTAGSRRSHARNAATTAPRAPPSSAGRAATRALTAACRTSTSDAFRRLAGGAAPAVRRSAATDASATDGTLTRRPRRAMVAAAVAAAASTAGAAAPADDAGVVLANETAAAAATSTTRRASSGSDDAATSNSGSAAAAVFASTGASPAARVASNASAAALPTRSSSKPSLPSPPSPPPSPS
ncbi:LOW QUALITY PROTEIN: hypothetical protein BU14_0249s0006 [Porphyra umbilicalis]|uniref:Uncharacterized protein n=1 Tax=Porphyra umbilicalis TaxID=2786 RepID=A0A1X6P2Z7_PORUM|nr:LOW QUALITY PROTEIN: hypothetical protein BU14_0249s0006 [Porphyra umbilicalis]|eukprot:OSX75187.1 LOW QUALITY PROTEIN: hypothetical protein BU14_0249s0006 [Porphyra umbilicalis]